MYQNLTVYLPNPSSEALAAVLLKIQSRTHVIREWAQFTHTWKTRFNDTFR